MRKKRHRGVSSKNKAVLNFIIQYKADHDGFSPSYLEIARALHLGKTTIKSHVDWLIECGLLIPGPNRAGLMIPGGQWTLNRAKGE